MKKILFKSALFIAAALSIVSCNEKEFLSETPKSFLSPENAYVTVDDFNMALNGLYETVRSVYYNSGRNNCFEYFMGTDVAQNGRGNANFIGVLDTWTTPQQTVIKNVWDDQYKLVADANTVITRVAQSDLNEDMKAQVSAEAKFFRAFGYRALVYLFGGVPLVLEEVTSPRADFVRASKEEVLKAMKEDFKQAADLLPGIKDVADGKISAPVAKFYLAETLLSLGDNQGAITELNAIISDPALGLMKQRFGSHKNDEGDVFWDLFRVRNQNRSSGNTEALWVIQMEPDVIGGFLTTDSYRPFYLERFAAPVSYSLTDPAGNTAMACNQGRSTLNIGGRGVSNMRNTDWWLYDLWESDWDNDIRNSKYNIVRDVLYDLPSSPYYGKSAIAEDSYSKKLKTDPWRWYPWPSKITTPGDHPDALFSDKEKLYLKSVAGATYLDQYMLRLPEVYLLRAEAYLKTDKAKAAADVNEVRRRAGAHEITAAEVSIDAILDERAREMVYEEMRRITLGRLGMYAERVRKCNSLNKDQVKDYMNVWPIPYSVIEANKDAEITQNPGYTN
ncbi:MAG: RagB/SusD family nutrient uptake outer membrane protein [Candidatus Cryptobacteroides sp.]